MKDDNEVKKEKGNKTSIAIFLDNIINTCYLKSDQLGDDKTRFTATNDR